MIDWIGQPLPDMLLKASLLALLGLGVAALPRRVSPGARHWSLAVVLAALLALPVGVALIPDRELPWLPLPQVTETHTVPAASPAAESASAAATTPIPTTAPNESARASSEIRSKGVNPGTWILAVYLLVATALLVRLGAGMVRVLSITRHATTLPDASWKPQLPPSAHRERVRVLTSARIGVPMTWGFYRPVILMPACSERWSAADRRHALLHEFAHVERGDWIVQWMAHVVRALYWFHPLVWLAARRLCLEAERAADDRVLLAGSSSADYAEQLLRLASGADSRDRPLDAVTMARRNQLWLRVDSVLQDTPRRCPMTRGKRWTLAIASAVLVTVVSPLTLTAASRLDDRFDGAAERATRQASRSPLMEAVGADDANAVRRLLAQGADPNEMTPGIGTPLNLAAAWGHADIARLLLDAGADPERVATKDNLSADIYRTPLANAARRGDAAMVELLLDRGAAVDRIVRGDPTPLMAAADEGHLPIADLLIDRGADVNAVARGDGSPLISAARSEHPELLRRLLSLGADPNVVVRGDGSPLIAAARSGNEESVALLLDAGADPDAFVAGDENPMYHAIGSGNSEIVRQLLDAGADPNREIDGDGTPLIVAADHGSPEIVELLLARGARADEGASGDGNALIAAARRGDRSMVEQLIATGADVNASVEGDGNPLIMAAGAGHLDVVEALLAAGAEIDRVVRGDENPLIRAAEGGHIDVVQYLLDRGADVNVRVRTDGEVRTALRMAQRSGHDEVVALLRAHGARD